LLLLLLVFSVLLLAVLLFIRSGTFGTISIVWA